ncbi:mechanosensitive ion channel family protein [Paraconexibacter sp.]|uniref:mechanosensitive ion channel family protein n=1 Tax=Paraconexibacter sp. TaxID=2949640 RepID=UPI003566E6F1
MSSIPFFLADVSPERLRSTCGSDPSFWCREVLEATEDRTLAGLADTLIGTPLALAAILLIALVANRLARRSIKGGLRRLHSGTVAERIGSAGRRLTPDALLETRETSLRAEQRIDALSGVLRSVASFVIFAIAAFVALGRLGVNLAPLLASAGIVGVALGFGSQTLVKDFLSGVFILIEDQYGVGDIVDLDGQTAGIVESVSLRTTRLRAVDGTVWHVPNGDIRRAGNQSQHWSRSLLDVEVAYDTDLERAKQVLQDVSDAAWKSDKDIIERPEVWGVEALGASGITVRVVVKTRPSEQYRVSRMLRERIKDAFDAEGIEIPFPQQTVWHRPADEPAGDRV